MKQISKIDHLGIAVKNLEEAVKTYTEILGVKPVEIEDVPQEKVRVAMFKVGESYIELLEGMSPDSAISKYIEKRGEGIHHIAFRVKSIEEAMNELKDKVRFVYNKPQVVAKGKRIINFIHPKTAHGVLIELVERKEEH